MDKIKKAKWTISKVLKGQAKGTRSKELKEQDQKKS